MQTLTAKQILALLKRGESETVEYKKTFDREAIETLSIFANTRGGRVIVGVSDTGQVLGVDPASVIGRLPACSKRWG